jgi:hypothetical protein
MHPFRQSAGRAAAVVWLAGMTAASWVWLMSFAALAAPAGASDYLIDVWSGDDGLPDSSVTAITQTPDGYLWIGTHNGVVRFDGVRFVTFDPVNTPELKHARVSDLFVDARGTLWINTHDGSMTAWRNGLFTHEWHGGQVSAVYLHAQPNCKSIGFLYLSLLGASGGNGTLLCWCHHLFSLCCRRYLCRKKICLVVDIIKCAFYNAHMGK